MISEYSCADFLDLVSPYFGYSLIPSPAESKLKNILSKMPAVSLVNLEFRLEEGNDQVDTNILIRQYEIPLLEQFIETTSGDTYKTLSNWCRDWQDPDLPFKFMISHIWIMFDVDQKKTSLPDPWIILSFRNLVLSEEVKMALIKKCVPYFNQNIMIAHWNLLENMFKLKPSNGTIPAIGIQNREVPALRTGVKPFYSFREMEAFLTQIGWDGDLACLKNSYSHFIEIANHTTLSLTFNEVLYTDIGIECWVERPNDKEQIDTILRKLVQMKLCTNAKRKELLHLIRRINIKKSIWSISPPNHALIGKEKVEVLICEIKLLYSKTKGLSAKAYVYFEQIF